MRPEVAADILREHNRWRRGITDELPAYSPAEIGVAIDAAVEALKEKAKREAAKE